MEGRETVRVPGDDGVRHDIQELRREMNARFDAMTQHIDQRFADMASREDAAHAAIGERIDALGGRVDRLELRMDALEGRMDALEHRMDALEHKIDELTKLVRLALVQSRSAR